MSLRMSGVVMVLALSAFRLDASIAPQRFRVEPPVLVFVDDEMPDLVEPWIAASPDSPEHAIVAGLVSDFATSVVARTQTGGRTWTPVAHEAGTRFPGGDPMVITGPGGRAYFSTIDSQLHVWSSSDGGARWTATTVAGVGGPDRQWLAQDHTSGPRRGRLYVAGKTAVRVFRSPARDIGFLSFSTDDGATFSAPRLFLPDPQRESLHTVTDLQVDQEGAVLIPYLTFLWSGLGPGGSPRPGLLSAEYWMTVSRDGRTVGEPTRIADVKLHGHADQVLSNKALGGGRLAIDRTAGAFAARRYFVYPDATSGVPRIVLVRSDGDDRWSTPAPVSDGPAGRSESNPAIAVSDTGIVAVTWNDRRGDSRDECFQAYVTLSVDGGVSFLPAQPLGDHPVCPASMRWLNGGDTQGLVALSRGRFLAAWIGSSGARSRVWTSVVDSTGLSVKIP